MTPSRLEILNDHYKDTFSYQIGYLKRRNRLSLYLFIALVIMFLEVVSPAETAAIILRLILKYLINGITLDAGFVRCFAWFFLFGLVVRYCQIAVTVERQYAYLHKLEAELVPFFSSGIPFTREGKSYLKNYPTLSAWSHILYTWIFPLILLLFTGIKIWIELSNDGFNFVWVVSVVFCSMIWITTYFYLRFRCRQA